MTSPSLIPGDVEARHCTVIEDQLSRVRDLFDELKLKYQTRDQELEAALNMCNRYQNRIDSVMGKLSRYDTVYLGSDKPGCDIQEIRLQIEKLEHSKEELVEIERLIVDIEVSLHFTTQHLLKYI